MFIYVNWEGFLMIEEECFWFCVQLRRCQAWADRAAPAGRREEQHVMTDSADVSNDARCVFGLCCDVRVGLWD